MKKRYSSLIRAAVGCAVALTLVTGCGGSNESYVFTAPGATVGATGTIEVQQVLARAVTQFVTHQRFVGLNEAGETVFGPETRVKSERIILADVPRSVTRLQIEYLAGQNVIGRTEVPVSFDSAGLAKVVDPGWTDTPVAPLSFSAQQVRVSVDGRPLSVVAGDFNGDGHLDLASANSVGGKISVALGRGDGTFGESSSLASGILPTGIAVGDFDGDRNLDLVVANYGIDVGNIEGPGNLPSGVGTGSLSVFHGRGDGTFHPRVHIDVGSGPTSVAVGDFNRDGRSDLACTDYRDNTVSILLGKPLSSDDLDRFHPPTTYSVGERPRALVAAYIDGDEYLDLAIANEGLVNQGEELEGDASILMGRGDGSFRAAPNVTAGSNPHNAQIHDLNGDGKADLVVANFISNDVSVAMGRGDGTFDPQVKYATPEIPLCVSIGDFNLDGRPDLAVACFDEGEVAVLAGRGNGTFEAPARLDAGDGTFFVTHGDFNHDGRPDFATANAGSSDLSVLLGAP